MLLRITVRRLAVLAAAGALTTTACGAEDPSAPPPSASDAPVELRHDTGTLTLDAAPVRIVTTTDETTELVVALGLQPVGIGSTRVAPTDGGRLEGYYIPAERLGDPQYVGGEQVSLEAVAALAPDLVVHGADDETAADLAELAPTAVFDVQAPGAWEAAVGALGAATGRGDRADEAVGGYRAVVEEARAALAPVAARYPRIAVIYPEYRGGTDNYVFGEEFALASAVPDLGFQLAGSPRAADAFPGVQTISTELYSTIEADLLLALGTVPWQETSSAVVLDGLAVPVVGVPLDAGQPSAGPLTSPELVTAYRDALAPLA